MNLWFGIYDNNNYILKDWLRHVENKISTVWKGFVTKNKFHNILAVKIDIQYLNYQS